MPPQTRSQMAAGATRNADDHHEAVTHKRKDPAPESLARLTRMTANHIFFSGGPLSNWNVGARYSGSRCLEILLPMLDERKVDHPSPEAFSTRLLARHAFNCGEQFMMAMKGWLFERDIEFGEQVFADDQAEEFEVLAREMLDSDLSDLSAKGPSWREMYDGTICKVLRAKGPKGQKALGRATRNFDDAVWTVASMPVVTSCSIARAEQDDQLRALYLLPGERKFVGRQAQRQDLGVGIQWDNKKIDNPDLWNGENRLGKCHDEAAAVVRKWVEEKETENKKRRKIAQK